tara:strand:+ start:27 stop:614 length:588 start_codon:yes stop_codon:yes gene_type:complete
MKAGNQIVEKKIYDNVWILLNKYGHKGWNMDDLAKMSGVAKNTLYKIVGNKETLLAKVVSSVQDEYTAVLEQATKSDEPLQALYSLTERIPLIFERYNIASIRELLIQYPQLATDYNEREERMTTALIALYEKGLAEGFVRKDIDVRFLTTLQRIVREQMIENADSPEEMAHNLRNALIIIIEGVLVRENKPCDK